MLLQHGKYKCVRFEQEHVDDCTRMIIKSFVTTNPIWSAFKPHSEDIFAIVRFKILPCLENGLSWILLSPENKVIGAGLNQDLYEFQLLQQISEMYPVENQIALFQFLKEVATILEQPIVGKPQTKGENIYGYYGVIDPDFKDKGTSFWFWHASFLIGKIAGVQKYYTRTTNPISYYILKKMGATDVNEYIVDRPDLGIDKFTINFIELDLQNKFKSNSATL